MPTEQELPLYDCHKQARAAQILAVRHHVDRTGTLVFMNPDFPNLNVESAYMEKHKPESGGYFVVYKDGYASFSPQRAFEDGYSRTPADPSEFAVWKGQGGRYFWNLKALNGKLVCNGRTSGYNTKDSAKTGIASVKRTAARAIIVDVVK